MRWNRMRRDGMEVGDICCRWARKFEHRIGGIYMEVSNDVRAMDTVRGILLDKLPLSP